MQTPSCSVQRVKIMKDNEGAVKHPWEAEDEKQIMNLYRRKLDISKKMVEIVHIQEFTQLNHRLSGKQPRLALERERWRKS